jgi:hypothetical protein
MVPEKQKILEALQARNFDIQEVARALNIHPKMVERVYKAYRKANGNKDVKQTTNLIRDIPQDIPGMSGKSVGSSTGLPPGPSDIEKDFIRKSYDLKMKALDKIEVLINTETDLSKLSTVVRTLDGITIERDIPDKPGEENMFFNIPKA